MKICKKCNNLASLLVRGGICKKCQSEIMSIPIRPSLYIITKNILMVSDKDLEEILSHNFKVHCSTGFKNDNEIDNYNETCKAYKSRFGKDFPNLRRIVS